MDASIVNENQVTSTAEYKLYEKVVDETTAEYIFKAKSTEINFYPAAIPLSVGDHTFVVQATAQGYKPSNYSNEVTYTVFSGNGGSVD